jgi:uncharacterized protein (DUF697 family)
MFEDLADLPAGGIGFAAAAVIGVGLLAARGGRPLLKGAIRGYLSVSEAARTWTATVVEQAQDLYEESKAELAESNGQTARPATAEVS